MEENKVKIDDEKLDELMEYCRQEYPTMNEYLIYVFCVDHLMSEIIQLFSTGIIYINEILQI